LTVRISPCSDQMYQGIITPTLKGYLCRLLHSAQSLGRGSIYDVGAFGSQRVKIFYSSGRLNPLSLKG